MDTLGVFNANQTSMYLDPHLNKGQVGELSNRFKSSSKIFY